MEPWEPERTVDTELAGALVETQFPDLAPARVEPMGVGFDNTAYLVNSAWVFRFPRRQVAVPLLEREARLLPGLAPRLPLAIPVPEHLGRPEERFPWPFAGYRRLPGRTACSAALSDEARVEAGGPLARFLAALHACPTEGAPRDETPEPALVHGDLYSRHLLVDERGALAGVIDWGEIHAGDRALDLAVVFMFLPPPAHGEFRSMYGEIDDATWARARLHAGRHSAGVARYATSVGDADLLRESRLALGWLGVNE